MTSPLASIRNCEGCTLCCKIFRIAALDKPGGQWCAHCSIGAGCKIYDTRPEECRAFQCGYLLEPGLDARWKPSEARLLLSSQGRTMSVHVDPQRPDAWKREPYYSSMKQWAKEALPLGSQVVVWIGTRAIVILPDHDADLGIVAPDEIAITARIAAPGGFRYEALKLKKDDPRAANLVPANFSMAAAAHAPAAS